MAQLNGGSLDTPPGMEWSDVQLEPEVKVKSYRSGKEFEHDSKAMIQQGWRPDNQAALTGHINVRRTAARVATGGFLVGGASRSHDQLTVTCCEIARIGGSSRLPVLHRPPPI